VLLPPPTTSSWLYRWHGRGVDFSQPDAQVLRLGHDTRASMYQFNCAGTHDGSGRSRSLCLLGTLQRRLHLRTLQYSLHSYVSLVGAQV